MIVVVTVLYAAGVVAARRRGEHWAAWRVAGFYVLGVGSYAVVSLGFLGVYSTDLRWAFTTRIELLLFVVPYLMSVGRPIALARAALTGGAGEWYNRFVGSRFLKVVGNAVFEPAFTFVFFLIFLTPFAATLRLAPLSQGLVSVLVPLMGMLMILPIVENTRRHSDFFMTVEFMLAFVALIFDAIPGILLRLNDTVLDHAPAILGAAPAWFPGPLHDQHLSGDFLWFLAEITDIPVLIILFARWSRLDKREAKSFDSLSDEEVEALTQAHLRGRG